MNVVTVACLQPLETNDCQQAQTRQPELQPPRWKVPFRSIARTRHAALDGPPLVGRADAGIDPSVGSVGDSGDDALAKSIIGLLKTAAINVPDPQKGPWKAPWKSLGHVEWETSKWVSWYNCERLHGAIGYITPHEAEKAFHANMNALDEVARPLNKALHGNPGRFKPQP